jgi:Tol biopolymer transport system component
METGIKRSFLFKLLSVTLVLIVALPLFTNAQAGKTNFTGNWAINEEKSNLGDGPRMGGGDFTAKQDGNLLTVERTFTNRDGQTMTSIMKYTLDGKESLNTSQRGDSKSVASWTADGKTLTISTSRTFNMNGETRNMQSVEVWTMTDPKTISIQSTMTTQNGERKLTMVYDKK